ncbi:dimethyl sulfoxide reductase subunit B [Escherichia coli]|nr:dimethyl sulfoxide reductase subunit B [Escherichia coli]
MTTQYGFFIDSSRCTGCKTCELACKDFKVGYVSFKNQLDSPSFLRSHVPTLKNMQSFVSRCKALCVSLLSQYQSESTLCHH